jgi:hypothetical protein
MLHDLPTLILTPRMTQDTLALEQAALAAGWDVVRLSGWRVPASLRAAAPIVYGEPLFAEVVAAELGLALLQTPPAWLPELPEEYRLRAIRLTTLASARQVGGPIFIKPADQKSFPAQVYASGADLSDAFGLEDDTLTLLSEPVVWDVEYRCVIADRTLLTLSPYWRSGALAQATDGSWPAPPEEFAAVQAFVARLLADPQVALPPACMLDAGAIAGRGWAVIEANSVWGAGLYGCEPVLVLRALRRAVAPASRLAADERRWARTPIELDDREPAATLPTPDAEGLITLYRPVGERELDLVAAANYRAFPPRLPEQPIFYPVLNERYATEIAQGWNTHDPASSMVGHVTCFRVRADVLDRYPVQVVGAPHHQELWVPAEELAAFNAAIAGPIRVIASYGASRE